MPMTETPSRRGLGASSGNIYVRRAIFATCPCNPPQALLLEDQSMQRGCWPIPAGKSSRAMGCWIRLLIIRDWTRGQRQRAAGEQNLVEMWNKLKRQLPIARDSLPRSGWGKSAVQAVNIKTKAAYGRKRKLAKRLQASCRIGVLPGGGEASSVLDLGENMQKNSGKTESEMQELRRQRSSQTG